MVDGSSNVGEEGRWFLRHCVQSLYTRSGLERKSPSIADDVYTVTGSAYVLDN
jgi:hypothetical protein